MVGEGKVGEGTGEVERRGRRRNRKEIVPVCLKNEQRTGRHRKKVERIQAQKNVYGNKTMLAVPVPVHNAGTGIRAMKRKLGCLWKG